MLLILPAEHAVDWRKPPVFTLALIVLCVLVFTLYQGKDQDKLDQALALYQSAELAALEGPQYEIYLNRRVHIDKAPLEDLLEAAKPVFEAQKWDELSELMVMDRAFFQELVRTGKDVWDTTTYERWLRNRTEINTRWIDRISAHAAGLTPADVRLANLITHQFLHGGWDHLLGNMIFLFLLGFGLEKILGGLRMTGVYLATGALAGLFFTLMASDPWGPLVGASGAISGLMGVYVGLYRLRSIRFFYMLGPYFNYFRAPALVILPVWLLKEVYAWFSEPGAQVAYMAHAGGLVAGWLASLYFTLVKNQEVPEAQAGDAGEARLRKQLSYALDALSEARFDQALDRLWTLHEKQPGLPQLEKPLTALLSRRPQDPRYSQWMQTSVSALIRRSAFAEALPTIRAMSEPAPRAAGELALQLFNRALAEGQVEAAEKAFAILTSCQPDPLVVEDALQTLIARLRELNLALKAGQYQKRLEEWQSRHHPGDSPA